jgi:5'-nucleotidase
LDVLPYVVLDVNGMQVGVLGLANENGAAFTNLGESLGLLNVDEVIPEYLDYFNGEGIDIIIALSGLGVARDREIAETYGGEDGIDVIVGNDSSVILGDPEAFPTPGPQPMGPYPLVFNEDTAPTLVVYAGKFGSFLGELNLSFDDTGILQSWEGGLHFMGEDVEPDPDMQAYVDDLVAGIDLDSIMIGETTTELFGSFRDYPWTENPLANLYADAFLEAGTSFGAQAAIVNAGSVWDTIPAGEITMADLTRAQPFFNWLIVMDVTGEQLVAALEHGVEQYGEPSGQSGPFLHVSGITYTFDPSEDVGHRIVDAEIDGDPVDPQSVYTIALNDFMANGGDGFAVLQEGQNTFNTGLSVTEVLQQYIRSHSPLDFSETGRITVRENQG